MSAKGEGHSFKMTEDEAIAELIELAIKGCVDLNKGIPEATEAVTHVLSLAVKAGLLKEYHD